MKETTATERICGKELQIICLVNKEAAMEEENLSMPTKGTIQHKHILLEGLDSLVITLTSKKKKDSYLIFSKIIILNISI